MHLKTGCYDSIRILLSVFCIFLTASPVFAELTLNSVYPRLGVQGKDLPVTLMGTGFDENTRISMYRDVGNKRSVIGLAKTPDIAFDIEVSGNTAYVVCHGEQWNGLQIFDVSNPSQPVLTGAIETESYSHNVSVQDGYAYVSTLTGLQIIDVSKPGKPPVLKELDPVNDIVTIGTTAYTATSTGFLIFDISNPENLKLIGSTNTHAFRLAVSGSTAYVANSSGLQVIDISTPETPKIIGTYEETWYIKDLVIFDDFLFVAASSGLQIIDVSNPENLKKINSVTFSEVVTGIMISGTDLFLTTATFEAESNSLYILDVSDPEKTTITSSVVTQDSTWAVDVSDNIAYVACGGDQWNGLQIINMDEIENIADIGWVDLTDNPQNLTISGNTAYVPSGSFEGWSRLHLVDVLNPEKPSVISSALVPAFAFEVALSGTTAFVACGIGLQVIDVSNTEKPVTLGIRNFPGGAGDVVVKDNICFVPSGEDGLLLIDITNINNLPVIAIADTPGNAQKVALYDNKAYVADDYSGLQIIDVSNSEHPKIIGSLELPDNAENVAVSDTTAFISTFSDLYIIDVNDPENPVIASNFPRLGDNRVFASGATAYIIDYFGLKIIDVSEPENPAIIGSIGTRQIAQGLSVSGSTAYISCMNGGTANSYSGLQTLTVPEVIKIKPEPNKMTDQIMSVTLPSPDIPGHYTLRVFNKNESYELPGAVTFVTPEEDYILDTKAIIVIGGSPGTENKIWKETKLSADYAYQALLYQGYTAESIYYISPDTGSENVDDISTYENIDDAINIWVPENPKATELLLYFIDHGREEAFIINPDQELKAEELDKWLDDLQSKLNIPVTFIYDACRSGTFLPQLTPPAGKDRINITSASDQSAYFLDQGKLSFSFQFWDSIYKGLNMGESYFHGKERMKTYQIALIDANGNSIPNEPDDIEKANNMKIRRGYRPQIDTPYIYDVSSPQTIHKEISAKISAKISYVKDGCVIKRVWAIITPPYFNPVSPDTPVTNLPVLELEYSEPYDEYKGIYNNFSVNGIYQITICAENSKGVYSLFRETRVTKAGDYISDVPDNQVLFGRNNSGMLMAMLNPQNTGITIDRVSAEIIRPDSLFSSENIDLQDPDGDGIYEAVYNFFNMEGTYIISVSATDSEGYSSPPVKTTITRIGFDSDNPAGDINRDGEADLKDVVIVLKVISDMNNTLQPVYLQSDINSDSRLGMEDAVYLIRNIAGLY